jgi:two-component system, OmpR family, sensor histidine kinase KdpD
MRARRFAGSILIVAAVMAVYHTLPVNNTTVALSLLLSVLGISAWWGLGAAILASVVAMLGFNYYFLPPVRTLTIQDPQNWVALVAFLVTAVTASQLAERARRRAAEAEARRMESERLYELVQAMMLRGSPASTIREFVHNVVRVFGCSGAAFYYRPTQEVMRSGAETKVVSDHDLMAVAELEDVSIDAIHGIATSPVRFGGRNMGSLALVGSPPSEHIVRAIVNLVAITIEKARAIEDASHAEAARQSEVLKAALLDSLAHDIKTPLTSIKAAVTSLLGTSDGGQHELLTIINEEADRLNRLAAEVIEMARVEAGRLHLEKAPVAIGTLVEQALTGFAAPLEGRGVTVELEEGLPEGEADPELILSVVRQLVENALKYSPAGSPLAVSARAKGGKIVMGVADRGPGIEENERFRIFEKFYRGRAHRYETKGTGMGLAIAKGIVEAHGERIWVESEPGQGAAFYFTLQVHGGRR